MRCALVPSARLARTLALPRESLQRTGGRARMFLQLVRPQTPALHAQSRYLGYRGITAPPLCQRNRVSRSYFHTCASVRAGLGVAKAAVYGFGKLGVSEVSGSQDWITFVQRQFVAPLPFPLRRRRTSPAVAVLACKIFILKRDLTWSCGAREFAHVHWVASCGRQAALLRRARPSPWLPSHRHRNSQHGIQAAVGRLKLKIKEAP